MKHIYEIAVTEQTESRVNAEVATATFPSHDDLKEIIAKVIAKGLFEENEAKVFAIGLKMFAGVMLAHRSESVFAELAPHFGAFMKQLKS